MSQKEYRYCWRNKWLTAKAETIDDMIVSLRVAANDLEEMRNDGITLDPDGGTEDDYAFLVTKDPKIAEKYEMEDISEEQNEEHSDDCDCRVCTLEASVGGVYIRLDKIEAALASVEIGSMCAENKEYIPPGTKKEEEKSPLN